MADARLDMLIDRFRNKTITDAEHAELLELLAQLENARTARQFFKDVAAGQRDNDQHFSATESQELYAAVQASIGAKDKKPVIRMLPLWKWAGIAAAACIVLVAGYWLMQPTAPKQGKPVAQTPAHTPDLLPGKNNKAVLILADNKQIVLDSTGAGLLSMQGNSRVIKDENGQIVYKGEHTDNHTETVYNTLQIPNGGGYELVLSDGSKVWLNSASRLRFPVNFSGNSREVELSGEAYFEIARDKARPFKVRFNNNTVEVLGTHFNVNSYTDETTQAVTLLEGSVNVSNAQTKVIIKPGQQARLNGIKNIQVKEVDVEEAIAWKNGYFIFVEEDIKSIMRKLARWYDFSPEYQGNIGDEQFGGMISRFRNISEVLKMFESTGTIHFKIIPGDHSGKGKKIIISK
ncbi:FecR family protein [Longitalea luteola]|uniref:FecR family protein n=1 Tax=Longitalea luteola TaxID=2812563 RepID=UPI001A970A66|nr:FecR family protein [Longitalea luteola]